MTFAKLNRFGKRRNTLSRAVRHIRRCLTLAADDGNVGFFTDQVLDHFVIATSSKTADSADLQRIELRIISPSRDKNRFLE
jgi:hypothetical protein